MKTCIICSLNKDTELFYKHPGMSDGRLNKCIECCKEQQRKRIQELMKNPLYVQSERARNRDKYARLGYKEKQKLWNKNKPWTKDSVFKNLNRDLKIAKGFNAHHWNYNKAYGKDILILSIKQHRAAHKHLTLCLETLLFKDENGNLLDSKIKHQNYLILKGIYLI